MAEIAFPDLPAYQEAILCPMTGEICAALQSLVKAYAPLPLVQGVDEIQFSAQIQFPEELNPDLDKHKLNMRLFEYRIRAERIACGGMEGDVCPTRQSMNESKVRVGLVKTVRKLIGKEQ